MTSRALAGTRYRSPSTREIPSAPSTMASASSHASPTTYDVRSSRLQDSRSARSTAYRQPSRAIAIAGIVPGPSSFGSQYPCSGGSSPAAMLRGARGHTSQSKSGGTAKATTTRTNAVPSPTQGARARASAWCDSSRPPVRKFSARSGASFCERSRHGARLRRRAALPGRGGRAAWLLPGARRLPGDRVPTTVRRRHAEVARDLGAMVVTGEPTGYGAAVHAGLLSATSRVRRVMDADGSFDPAELLGWPTRSGPDAPTSPSGGAVRPRRGLAAARPARQRRAGPPAAPPHRHGRLHDIGPMRAARRDDLLSLDLRDRRFGYPLELLLKAARAAGGSPRSTSPTTRAPRHASRSPARCAGPRGRSGHERGAGPMTAQIVVAKAPVPAGSRPGSVPQHREARPPGRRRPPLRGHDWRRPPRSARRRARRSGDFADAVRRRAVRAPAGWSVGAQRGSTCRRAARQLPRRRPTRGAGLRWSDGHAAGRRPGLCSARSPRSPSIDAVLARPRTAAGGRSRCATADAQCCTTCRCPRRDVRRHPGAPCSARARGRPRHAARRRHRRRRGRGGAHVPAGEFARAWREVAADEHRLAAAPSPPRPLGPTRPTTTTRLLARCVGADPRRRLRPRTAHRRARRARAGRARHRRRRDAAVDRLTRDRGGAALRRDVFDPLPGRGPVAAPCCSPTATSASAATRSRC